MSGSPGGPLGFPLGAVGGSRAYELKTPGDWQSEGLPNKNRLRKVDSGRFLRP